MSAYHLCDLGHFSPLPDLRQDGSNIGKGRKRFASGVQEDQVVVATFRQGTLGANPEGALLQACKPSGGLGFSKVTISPLVILHARLGNERCSVGQSAHEIGQVMMGVVLKCVANRERGVLWNRQSIRAWQTPGQCHHARSWQPEGDTQATAVSVRRAGYKTAVCSPCPVCSSEPILKWTGPYSLRRIMPPRK